MNMHKFSENILVKNSFEGTLANSTQTGTAVDCYGYRRAAIIFSTYTGAATTSNFTVEESADNSTWTTVTGATLGTAIAASQTAQAPQVVDVDLAKRKRYLRVNSVGTGTAGAAVANICLFMGQNQAPTQDTAALAV